MSKRPFRRYVFYKWSENPVWRDFFHIYQLQKKGEFIFMKKLSYYLKQHIPGYLFAILSMVIAVSLDLLTPQVTRHIVDDVLVGGQMGKLKYLLLAILLIGIGRCIFQYTKEFTFDKISSTIATDMRRDLFAHIQSLSADFFDKTSTGELMARVKDDIDRIWNALGYVGMLMMEVAFHVTVILFCMYSLNWKLAILPTLCMIFCAVLAILMENRLGTIYEEISEENAKLNTVAEENLAGVRTVKAFAREKFEIKKFLSHNNRYYELNMTQSRVFVRYSPYFSLIGKLLPLLVLLIGGYLFLQGELTLGALSAFVQYSTNIVWPMEMLGWLSNDFSSAVGSYRKIRKVYDQKPSIQEPEEPIVLPEVTGDIRFEPKKTRVERRSLSLILRIGIPAGLQSSMFSISNVLIQSAINSFGAAAIAGNTAAASIEGFATTVSNSISQAALTFSSQNMGAEKYQRVRRVLAVCLAATLVGGLTLGLLIYAFGTPLLSLFNTDPDVIANGLIRVSHNMPLYVLFCMQDTFVGQLRGIGYSLLPTITSLSGICLLRVVWLYTAFAASPTLDTLYLSYPVSWAATLFALIVCYAVVVRKMPRA